MNELNTIGTTFTDSLRFTWLQIAGFLPRLLSALLILIIGLFASAALGELAKRVLNYIQIDRLMDRTGLRQRLERYNLNFSLTNFFAALVRWFFYIITFIAVADVLQIPQLTTFLVQIASYLPNVIVAIVIMAVGFIVARFAGDLIRRALSASRFTDRAANMLGSIGQWAIIVFAFMAALLQLGVAPSLIQILFTGLVVMLALAGGIAFGLGGKDRAADLLQRTQDQISRRARRV